MAESMWKRLRIRARHRRYVVRSNPPRWHRAYRIAVAVVGTIVLLCGIVAIPYPGGARLAHRLPRPGGDPGLGVRLGSPSPQVRPGEVRRWMEWIGRQHWSVQSVFWIGTCMIVVGTLWLLGGALYTAAGWVNLDYAWLASPLFS